MTSIAHRLYQQPWPEGQYSFWQMGFVVDDVIAAAQRWATTFGVGPFHVLPPQRDVPYMHRGTPSQVTIQVAVAQAGPTQIELIQQLCDRPTIFREFLADRVAAFHQICTVTSDYDATKAHYLSNGYELAGEIVAPVQRVAYFDTVADFGFFTEVVEDSPQFLKQLAAISRTCAEWDGTDPVRLLTRDGYRTP
jgi:hypothetical protein